MELGQEADSNRAIVDTSSIDPDKLITQDGPNAGAIEAAETSPGTIIISDDPNRIGQPHDVIDGLPEATAQAEKNGRLRIEAVNEMSGIGINEERSPDEISEDALVTQIRERARALIPNASEEVKNKVADAAAERFKKALKAKHEEEESQERERQQVEADKQALELLDKLNSDMPLAEIDPSLGEVEEPDTIDATEDKSLVDENTGDWKPGVAEDPGQTPPTPGGPIASMHLMEKDRENQLSES